MRRELVRTLVVVGASITIGLSSAATFDLHKNDVISIKFDSTLSTNLNQVGDKFQATVTDGSVLPKGSYFEGIVTKVQQGGDDQKPILDLKFTEVYFPNGAHEAIDAAPVPLSRKYEDKSKTGRYTAKPSITQADAIGAGALGGLLLGTIFHKPFEGTFLGTLAGIVLSESDRGNNDVTLKKGTEAGAYIRTSIVLDDAINSAANQGSSSSPVDPHNSSTSNQSMAEDNSSNGNEAPNPPADPATPRQMDIAIGNTHLKFADTELPYQWGKAVMVPLNSSAKQLALSVDKSGDYIFVDSDSHSLRLQTNSNIYILDGTSGTMDEPLTLKGETSYVPVAVLSKLMHERLQLSSIIFPNFNALNFSNLT